LERVVRLHAPAKINLFLRVLGKREDGYHELETVFQAVDLEDELIIHKAPARSSLEVPGHEALETESNLVMRALRWLEKKRGRELPVAMRLMKNIPMAAGLGGGSSNAAAALLGIRALYDLDLEDHDLLRGAASLGADVPFFLYGGTAVGEGIGELLTPVELPENYGLVLVNPGFPVQTATVFRRLSKTLTGEFRKGRVWAVIEESRSVEDLLHNDLQSVAEELHPEISNIRHKVETAGAKRALMTGSGPTVFGIAETGVTKEIVKSLPASWKCFTARPTRRGIRID
jgi:4-diphosphocytidyl-2-C-methyl-D-erythritol kinase